MDVPAVGESGAEADRATTRSKPKRQAQKLHIQDDEDP